MSKGDPFALSPPVELDQSSDQSRGKVYWFYLQHVFLADKSEEDPHSLEKSKYSHLEPVAFCYNTFGLWNM